MKRLVALALAFAALPAPALAQTCVAGQPCEGRNWGSPPYDSKIHQAVLDTLQVSFNRRGFCVAGVCDNSVGLAKDAVNATITALSNLGKGNISVPTWKEVIRGLGNALPWPQSLGKDGHTIAGAGGNWGGGGASADIVVDCGDLDLQFGPGGDLLIPASYLGTGGAVQSGKAPGQNGSTYYYFSANLAGQVGMPSGTWWVPNSSTKDGLNLWFYHHRNKSFGADKRMWYGFLGMNGGNYVFVRPSYINNSGGVVGRHVDSGGGNPSNYWFVSGQNRQDCPDTNTGGGDFHFYGAESATTGQPYATCTWYTPNPSLGFQGYAMNDKVSIDWFNTADFPNALQSSWGNCLLDPAFVRKLVDAIYKKATETPGYAGTPYAPIEANDVRPGNSTVTDLGDPVQTGTPPTGPGPNVNDPPPTTTTPPATGGGGTDTCDFGAGGCDNPNTPAPTLEAPPTGIMDPIFDWLPDLPSITLDTNNTECPVWAINLTSFGGPEWQFLVDKQCELTETFRPQIGALMLVLFSLCAGFIILRA